MLPGFRFLFAAIMLSMSLLIFGLGAAALLRAAHESFASNPSWHGAPEATFAQRPETTLPVLATLRVDTSASAMDKPVDQAKAGAVPADQPLSSTDSLAGEPVAASRPTETPVLETVKPDSPPVSLPLSENPPAPEATPATAEATAETRIAAIAASEAPPASSGPDIAPPTNPIIAKPTVTAPTTAAPAVATPVLAAGTDSMATKIATLGGPPVDIAETTPIAETSSAKADQAVIKRRGHARRSLRRRRLAALARLAALQQQQFLQANPFAQQPLTSVAQPITRSGNN